MEENILGCFVSSGSVYSTDNQSEVEIANKKGEIFREYIYGKDKLVEVIKELKHISYGNDLKLVLFQFYVNPIPYMRQHIKEIESFRKKEKAIGIPIIVDDENFFNKSEKERYIFLKESVLQKMDLLAEVLKKKKLDTNFDLLKSDLRRLFEEKFN